MSTPTTPPTPQTAEAVNRPQTGTTTLTPNVALKPAAPVSQASLVAAVNKAQGAKVPIPAGMVSKSTDDITSPWLRACLYGEIDSWKTVTAAEFGSPEDVRIILTRGEDQLRGLTGKGYKFVECNTVQKLRHAILYPETIWPEWAGRANRTVVVDDITRAKDLLLEDNETDDQGREKRDNRMIHRDAKADMGDLIRSLQAKPLHVILVALAQIYTNNITREETVTPDVPPGMSRMLLADASFVFFLDKTKRMMLTTNRRETYQQKNDKGVLETFTRTVLARHKLPKMLEGKGVINEYEKVDLAALWTKIQSAKAGA